MNAKQRVQVPFGLKKKLMAATSMLLVAAIMLVSTSYAWFTLSTAPEITGITTSVGANGNLEIALLNSETYANPELITSNAGDSMAATNDVTVSNITWGNLIDLSDERYGLGTIKMYPAALPGDGSTVSGVSPLATPTYGADGRVNTMENNTLTGVYDGTQFATTATGAAAYGVRAVGISSSVSPRQMVFNMAKSNFTMNASSAESATKSAVNSNMNTLMSLATGDGSTYTKAEVLAMQNIAKGVQSSLNNIVSAYVNFILAKVAADTTNFTDADVSLLNTTISGITSASTLLTLAGDNSVATTYKDDLEALATAQTTVAGVISTADTVMEAEGPYTGETADTVTSGIMSKLIGGTAGIHIYNATGGEIAKSASNITAIIADAASVYISGGAVGTVATYTGNFQVADYAGIPVWAGSYSASTTGELDDLNIAGVTGTFTEGAANISDHYGYIVDFAFRTNAAGSNLHLQTAARNRVYSDATAEDLATMGGGSFGTFHYSDAGMTAAQAENLMESYRVVFFDPTSNTVLATAMFTNIVAGTEAGTLTAALKLTSQTEKYMLGKDAYEADADTYMLKSSIIVDGVSINPATYAADGADELTNAEYTALAKEKTEAVTTTTGEGESATTTYTLGKDAYEQAYKVKDSVTITEDGQEVTVTTSANGCHNYVAKLSAVAFAKLAETTVKTVAMGTTDESTITSLSQNIAQRVSMLVYLDGNNIDNAAVNATGTSGSLDLNVQFSSDATLNPMENSTLRGLEKESE